VCATAKLGTGGVCDCVRKIISFCYRQRGRRAGLAEEEQAMGLSLRRPFACVPCVCKSANVADYGRGANAWGINTTI
jgi:hypothetical protein